MLRLSILLSLLFLSSCTANWVLDTPSGRKTKAYCNTLASNGEDCVQWSEDVSDAAVGKVTPSNTCCTQAGQCRVPVTMARSVSTCYCTFSNGYQFANFVGKAC